MAYLGNDLQVAYPTYKNIDDISGSFNSSATSFPLLVNGVAPVPLPLNSQQCLISVGGVVQRPDDSGSEGFRLSGGNIIFASAPTTGADFFGVILAGADYVNVGANYPSGSAAVPSITFDSDLDTGIYNSAANEISFSTGGTQRLSISSAGQLSNNLGSAAAPSYTFSGDVNTGIYSPGADQVAISTNGTGRLFVDSSGRLLLGTSSSRQVGLVTASQQIEGTGADSSISIVRNSNNDGEPRILLAKSRGTAVGGVTTVQNNDRLGKVEFAGANGTDITSLAASILCEVDGVVTGGGAADLPGRLVFSTTADGASSPTERLRIDSSGRVGIGTTSPSSPINTGRLMVQGGDIVVRDDNVGNNWNRGTLVFDIRNSNGDSKSAYIQSNKVGDVSSTLQFFTTATHALSERMRIDDAGRLLVGTSTSIGGALLQVADAAGNCGRFYGSSSAINGAYLVLGRSQGTTGSPSVVASGDGLGTVFFDGYDGSAYRGAAAIRAEVDGTPGANDMPGRLVFSTTKDGQSNPTEACRIDSAQNLLVGTTLSNLGGTTATGINLNANGIIRGSASGDAALLLNRIASDGVIQFFQRSGTTVGTISVTTSATAYNTSSDYRLKENVAPVTDGITRLQQLKPSRFNFIADPATTVDGFIAHEVQTIVPEAITGTKDEVDDDGNPIYQGIDQSKLVPLLTAALQEAVAKIESLEARLTAAGI